MVTVEPEEVLFKQGFIGHEPLEHNLLFGDELLGCVLFQFAMLMLVEGDDYILSEHKVLCEIHLSFIFYFYWKLPTNSLTK